MIDHTLLRPEATREDIRRLLDEARRLGFAAVCVNPAWVPLAARTLSGTPVKVATVVGFPLGAMHTAIKALEARRVHDLGADEIDMVLNQGELVAGRIAEVGEDVSAVRRAIGRDATLKVIIETAARTPEEIRAGARAAVEAGADFLKTSTGFGPGGATVEAVRLLREVAGPRVGVKASGGIRTIADARAMVAAGATRLGTSAGVAIAAAERSS
jgi:deoxyribose-phosphate aldolase